MTTNRYNFQIEVAVLVSVLLHALTFGLYQTRTFWERLPLIRSLAEARPTLTSKAPVIPQITFVEAPTPKPQRPPPPPEQPNIYMETHDNQASATPPETDFYGTRNTVAANPENPTKKEGATPYLKGEKTGALASETVPVAKPALMSPPAPPPVAPTPKPAPPAARGTPEPPAEKPKEVPNEGLAQAEPPKPEQPKFAMLGNQEPSMITPPAPPSEPAPHPTLAAGSAGGEVSTVRSRLTASGVSRQGVAAFNVAESPFGAYDREIIRAVQSRWYNILDQFGLDTKGGTVTLYFELYDDGHIGKVQRKENTAGEMNALWCEKAVTEAAPFEPLPDKLRLLLGGQPRDVTFTFYY